MRRISVTGSSGSGKSTLCRELACILGAPHIELDALQHQPNWTERPADEFESELAGVVARDAWIVDGNYTVRARPLVWPAADTVIWLDLPLRLVMRQVIGRTLRRQWKREVLWNGNRERWHNMIDPRPSRNVMLWALTRHGRKRESMLAAMEDPQWGHLTFVRLRSRAEIGQFVDDVRRSSGSVGLRAFDEQYAAQVLGWAESAEVLDRWASFSERPTPEIFQRWLSDADTHGYLLVDGEPTAYGELWVSEADGEVELAHLLVAPSHRGRGVGRALVEALVEKARAFTVPTAWVRVVESNEPALRCYRGAGFSRAQPEQERTFNDGQPRAYAWLSREL